MAEFSLGAAIGATGKFPRYTAPDKTQEFLSDKSRDELARLRAMVSADDKVYHNVYVPAVQEETVKFIDEQLNLEKQRDPEIVSKTHKAWANWKKQSNLYLNKSASLKNLETFAEKGGGIGQYVPESVKKARDIVISSKTEPEMLEKLKQNPDIFADGYVSFDPETGTVKFTADDVVDFSAYIRKNLLTKEKANVESEVVDTKNGIRRRTTVFTIPANAVQADQFKKVAAKRGTAKEDIPNAYDIGYNWFANSPTAQRQYKSIKYWQGEKDVLDKSTDEIYKDFYKEYILPAIPQYEKGSEINIAGRTININNAAVTTPAGFQVAQQYTVNYGLGNIKAKSTALLSKTGAGTKLLLPRNKYIINMETGKSAFGETDVTQGTFYVSTVSVMPSVKLKDGTYRPLAEKEVTDISNAGNGGKIMYLPWALADEKDFYMSTLPNVGKNTYAIPLFEPTVKDGKSMMVIPKTARSGDRPDALSYVLGAIFREQKLSNIEAAEWKTSYRKIMGDVIDETQIQ